MGDLIRDLLPRQRVSLLGGPSQAGKTTLLSWILRQVQLGQPVFGAETEPPKGGIFYVTADQPWEDYQKVFARTGLEISGYYSYADDPDMNHLKFSSPDVIGLLRKGFLKANPAPDSVVVVDVLGLFFENLINYRHVMGCIWEYSKWCRERNVAMIGSVHAGKQKGEKDRYIRLFDRVMGGNPMRAASSTVMYLTSKEETGKDKGFQELEIIPRHGSSKLFHCRWTDSGVLVPDAYETLGTSAEEVVDKTRVYQLLSWVPYEEPGISTKDWQLTAGLELGISRATFYRWKGMLEEENRVAKGLGGVYVRLRED